MRTNRSREDSHCRSSCSCSPGQVCTAVLAVTLLAFQLLLLASVARGKESRPHVAWLHAHLGNVSCQAAVWAHDNKSFTTECHSTGVLLTEQLLVEHYGITASQLPAILAIIVLLMSMRQAALCLMQGPTCHLHHTSQGFEQSEAV